MSFDPNAPLEQKIAHYTATAQKYISAVNAKDIETILGIYAVDAAVHDPVGQRDFVGKTQLREFYAGVCAKGARLETTGPIRGSYGPAVATPLRAIVPGATIDVITVTRFNDAGLVVEYSAYWGPGNITQTG